MVLTMRSLYFSGVLAIAGLVGGCMGPTFIVQQYPGAVRPSSSIAILRVNGKDPVRLLTLDDEDVAAPVTEDGRLHIEVLPGRHRLSVKNAAIPSDPAAPLAVEVEAGKVYRVAYSPEARIFEVDRDSDKALRDVTVTY